MLHIIGNSATIQSLSFISQTTVTTLALRAMQFARQVHTTQRRKYTGNLYADHLAEVAGIVATVNHTQNHPYPEASIAVAWLHDCVEDQGVTYDTLHSMFGEEVARSILLLSDLEVGNRASRKAAGRVRLAAAPAWVQDIKVADLISNTSSIVMHDANFASVYLNEKRLLLDVLTKANPDLLAIAREVVEYAPASVPQADWLAITQQNASKVEACDFSHLSEEALAGKNVKKLTGKFGTGNQSK